MSSLLKKASENALIPPAVIVQKKKPAKSCNKRFIPWANSLNFCSFQEIQYNYLKPTVQIHLKLYHYFWKDNNFFSKKWKHAATHSYTQLMYEKLTYLELG